MLADPHGISHSDLNAMKFADFRAAHSKGAYEVPHM